jgi:hypothetical protein
MHKWEGSVYKWEGSVHKWEGSVHKWEGSVYEWEGSVHKWGLVVKGASGTQAGLLCVCGASRCTECWGEGFC